MTPGRPVFHLPVRRPAADRDRRRDNSAAATTGATLRYDWRDVVRTQCETAAQVHAALRKRGYTGGLKPCSATCTALAKPGR